MNLPASLRYLKGSRFASYTSTCTGTWTQCVHRLRLAVDPASACVLPMYLNGTNLWDLSVVLHWSSSQPISKMPPLPDDRRSSLLFHNDKHASVSDLR